MKTRIGALLLVFTLALCALTISVNAAEKKTILMADFKLIFDSNGKQLDITNGSIQSNSEKFPYILDVKDVTKGAKSYEWFVKMPDSEYVPFDIGDNSVITVWNYGVTSIKLQLNKNNSLIKECSITVNPPSSSVNELPKADFKILFMTDGKYQNVTNSVLPTNINDVPFELYCSNLSTGATKFEWFVQYPGKGYELADKTPNPKLTMKSFGSIKLRVNGDDSYTKEYLVASGDYSSSLLDMIELKKKSVSNDVYGGNNRTLTDFKLPVEKPITKTTQEPIDFKIIYVGDKVINNVTDASIPRSFGGDPIYVYLNNTSKVNGKFQWYLKAPSMDKYLLLDYVQNAKIEIEKLGVTKFKLRMNEDDSYIKEYSVTAFSKEEFSKNQENSKTIDSNESVTTTDFNIIYNEKGKVYDVTNAVLPLALKKLPYKVYLNNISKGDTSYEWLVEYPDQPGYQVVKDPNLTINSFGTARIKLKLKGNNRFTKSYTVSAYYFNDVSGQVKSQQSLDPKTTTDITKPNINAIPDFKILFDADGIIKNVTNDVLPTSIKEFPYTIYLNNESKGDFAYEWFVKLPGGDYTPVENIPNPIVTISKPGISYFKLIINGDSKLTKEYFVRAFSNKDFPTISNPTNDSIVEWKDLSIQWNRSQQISSYRVTLINETTRKLLYYNKIIKGTEDLMVPQSKLGAGCVYRVIVINTEIGAEKCLKDEVVFTIEGVLNVAKEPYGRDDTLSSAVIISQNKELNGVLASDTDNDYYSFNLTKNSNFKLQFSEPEGNIYNLDLIDGYGIVNRTIEGNGDASVDYSKVLIAGKYYLKISRKSGNLSQKPYTVKIENEDYNPKILLLYTGYGYQGSSSLLYPEFTDSDINKLLDNSKGMGPKEFLIIPGSGGYGVHEAIVPGSEEKAISSIKIERDFNVEDKKIIQDEIRGKLLEYIDLNNDGILEKNPGYTSPEHTLDDFAKQSVDFALKLIAKDKNVKLWFSFPAIVHVNLADYYTQPFKNKILRNIKSKLDAVNPNYWVDNVMGFYYAHEDIPWWYTSFETKNNNFLKTNPVVKSMNSLSSTIHEGFGKMFIWIPYYGESPDNPERIGYLADNTNIFDYVIIQPNRTFDNSGYVSSGTGDDNITLEKVDDKVKATVNCPGATHMTITVWDDNGWLALTKEVDAGNSSFTFTQYLGVYTVQVKAQIGGSLTTSTKAIYCDKTERWKNNIPAMRRSVISNEVYEAGTNGRDGKAITKKTSNTKVGFEMEIEATTIADPNNISLNNVATAAKDDTDAAKRAEVINKERENYLKYLVTKKKDWYKEYLKAFNFIKNESPVAFYAGQRNELMDSLNEIVKNPSTGVFDAIRKFFSK